MVSNEQRQDHPSEQNEAGCGLFQHRRAGGFMTVARRWLKAGCTPGATDLCVEFSEYANAVVSVAMASDGSPLRSAAS